MIDAIPLLLAPEGYQISRSVRLRSSASAYFNRTPASAGNRKTWTWSGWVKRGTINAGANMLLFSAAGTTFDNAIHLTGGGTNDVLRLQLDGNNAGVVPTVAVYRDPSSWYHIIVAVDTTQATSANRVRIYVNGTEVAYGSATYPTQNYDTMFNSVNAHNIGRSATSSNQHLDGYLTEINFIDGQALTPSSFGETNQFTGVWQPRKYTGTYGTNGFYLNFSDNSNNTAATIGKDYSGNGNNWTPNNISVTAGTTFDSMLDVPTQWADGGNGRGNYATLNPLSKDSLVTLSNANLGFANAINSASSACSSIALPTSGKWYAEFRITTVPVSGNNELVGITSDAGAAATIVRAYSSNGQYFNGSAWVSLGGAWAQNDVIGIAGDVTNSQLSFYKNGTLQGSAQTYAFPNGSAFSIRGSGVTTVTNFSANFGQQPFAYTPPTGFLALNTLNLPTPTILKGNQFFDAKLFTSNDSVNVISGLAFAPDFVWTKRRDQAYNHDLYDSVRGIEKRLQSNNASAENTDPNTLTAFNSDGFTLGTNDNANNSPSGGSAVAWTWKEGPTQGFDIVTYTGTGVAGLTVNHSLGVAPRMMIVKRRDAAGNNWNVYHAAIGNTTSLLLNDTAAQQAASAIYWNNTSPTSSVFTLGTGGNGNALNATYVAYLFSEVAGFSRFGNYTGNGSTDGPFVYLGFRPRFILYKRTDTSTNWVIWDTSRNTYNVVNNYLLPNSSGAEGALDSLDILSNGFKLRTTNADNNGSGGTFVYAAFAENPFKNALAR